MMSELYLPIVRSVSSGDYYHYVAQIMMEQNYRRQGYTAHLHVNVLPDYQRQGIGSQLMQALETKLTEMYVEGIYLVCDRKNKGARAFYEHCGFEDIDYPTGSVVYGKKFFTED